MKKYYHQRNRGAAIITAVLFFVIISVTLAVGLSSPVVREYTTSRDFEKSKGAYYLSEAGHEDALYRVKYGKQVGTSVALNLNGSTATTTITTTGGTKTINSSGSISNNFRKVKSRSVTEYRQGTGAWS
jgi:hypothetical protein